jgi:hypothetical protein
MFKATYLISPNDITALENIIKEYNSSQSTCTGKPLTQFHSDNLTYMMDIVKKGMTCAKNAKEINKKSVKDEMKA